MSQDFTVEDIINTKRNLRSRATLAYSAEKLQKELDEAANVADIMEFARSFLRHGLEFSDEEIDAINFTEAKINAISSAMKVTCQIDGVYLGFRTKMGDDSEFIAEAGLMSYHLKAITNLEDLGRVLDA